MPSNICNFFPIRLSERAINERFKLIQNNLCYALSAVVSATYTFSTGTTNTGGVITANLSTGVSGGQSVIGGTSASNNLTLSSTSSSTKGKILFGSNSAFDENDTRLGIGTASPGTTVDLLGNIVGNVSARLQNTNNAGGSGSRILMFNENQSALAQVAFFNSATGFSPNGIIIHTTVGKTSLVASADAITFGKSSTIDGNNEHARFTNSGLFGVGINAPSAVVHIKAGTASANTAPLKLTAGTNLTTPENGAFEFDGTNLYFTVGGVRKTVTLI